MDNLGESNTHSSFNQALQMLVKNEDSAVNKFSFALDEHFHLSSSSSSRRSPANTSMKLTSTSGMGNDDESMSTGSAPIPDEVKEEDIDALLANELNQMSLEERERTYEEIHGVQQIDEETPQKIHGALIRMQAELETLPAKPPAYFLALNENPEYLADPNLRLMFLRSTNFKPREAAQKLVSFLQGKMDLFGAHTLCRSLYLSDLDKDDLACLKSGAYQLLPSRDSTGRAIIADFHLIIPTCYKHPRNLLRALAYMQLVAAEDVETQKRGMIGLVYYVGKFNGEFNHELNKQVAAIAKWFPVRLTGYHMCFNDAQFRAWKPLAMWLMGKKLRIRVRFHDGTHTECRYSLMTFGVPVKVLPITYQGELKTVSHMKWIAKHRIKDDALKRTGNLFGFDRIDLPGRCDVILRRGRVFHDHPGNVRMRNLIDESQNDYANARMKEKASIAMRIVNTIRCKDGGRFLERDTDGWWIQVMDKEACKRVSKAIRSMRTAQIAKQQHFQVASTAPSSFITSTDGAKRSKLGIDPSKISNEERSCFAVLCFTASEPEIKISNA